MPPQITALYCDTRDPDPAAADRGRRLTELKQRIEQQLPGRVRHYTTQWDAAQQRITGLEAWGRTVLEDVWSQLEAETSVAAAEADISWQQAEQRAGLQECLLCPHTAGHDLQRARRSSAGHDARGMRAEEQGRCRAGESAADARKAAGASIFVLIAAGGGLARGLYALAECLRFAAKSLRQPP
jgi:hypothetical protein